MTENNNMNKDEQIGFHKGSIATLAKEREELLKIVNISGKSIKIDKALRVRFVIW